MGRFDALTQLEENQQPVKKPDTDTVSPVRKKPTPPLLEKPARREGQEKENRQNGTHSPVLHTEANNRPVKPRHAFDIYQDQYESLLELSLEERRQGGTGSMSAMVREALDKYIAAQKKQ